MEIYQSIDTQEEEETIKDQYNIIDGISVDFGVMQKTRKAYVIKSEFLWDDIGSFAALGRFLSSFRGNNVAGKTFMEQCENCSVFGADKLIIGFGIKDLVIVDAGDVILVMDKNRDQEIKYLVNELKQFQDYNSFL